MAAQSKDESIYAYLKQFRAKLVEVEKHNDRLTIMAFKHALYAYSPLSQKLNKKMYDYVTLVECFDIVDDLSDWDDKTRKKIPNQTVVESLIEKEKVMTLRFPLLVRMTKEGAETSQLCPS